MSMESTGEAIPHDMIENYHLNLSAQSFDYAGMQWLNGMLEGIEETSIFNIEIESPRGPDREWIYFHGDRSEQNLNSTKAHTAAILSPTAPRFSSDGYGGIEQAKFCDPQKFDDDDESRKLFSKENKDASEPKAKKSRTQKLGIRTRTKFDSLEDGFKWRKYGRKLLKSRGNPRSYYKCADSKCGVKKTVERDANDPEFLITTYEGKHNHPNPEQAYLFEKPITLQPRIPGAKPAVLLVNTGVCI